MIGWLCDMLGIPRKSPTIKDPELGEVMEMQYTAPSPLPNQQSLSYVSEPDAPVPRPRPRRVTLSSAGFIKEVPKRPMKGVFEGKDVVAHKMVMDLEPRGAAVSCFKREQLDRMRKKNLVVVHDGFVRSTVYCPSPPRTSVGG